MVVPGAGSPPKPHRPVRLLTEVQLSGFTPGAPGMMAPTAAAASAGSPTSVDTGFNGTTPPGHTLPGRVTTLMTSAIGSRVLASTATPCTPGGAVTNCALAAGTSVANSRRSVNKRSEERRVGKECRSGWVWDA